jgi:hypothetical protein
MALHHTVVLIDDLDGSQAQRTVAFSLDGQQYEIDLSAPNIERLHDVLAPFTTTARVANARPGSDRRTRRPRDRRITPKPTPQGATPTADVPTPESQPDTLVRPPVPVAHFSNPSEQPPPRAAAAPKPDTADLFRPAS